MKPSTATADKRQRCVEMHKQRESYKIYQKNKTDDMPSTPRSSSHPTKRGGNKLCSVGDQRLQRLTL